MKANKKYIGGILVVFIVLLGSYVYAFGVGSAYHKEHPLEISPGETKEITFNLQNMVGSEDITAKASIAKGSEIMNLIDSGEILVPIGGSIDIRTRVSIPSDAEVGDTYSVGLTFTTIPKSEAGTFGFGSSVGRNFEVIVVPAVVPITEELPEEKPVSPLITYVVGIVILIVIILVILLIVKKRKK